MSQDDTPDLATRQAGKVAPEAVALRAQPRAVTRLNRRTLAVQALLQILIPLAGSALACWLGSLAGRRRVVWRG